MNDNDPLRSKQQQMLEHLQRRGVRDPAVLAAMSQVRRERYVPAELQEETYDDGPLPIGSRQTISQPLMVAMMTAALELSTSDIVLEVGTGSGYAAAVLASIAQEVYSVERLRELADEAEERLGADGYTNVHLRVGDGTLGWADHAPYDAIVVTAGGPCVPPALVDQLGAGGRLVIPVGSEQGAQKLIRVRKSLDGDVSEESLGDVRFVPLIGDQGW